MMFSNVDVQEKENLTRQVVALVTPKRCPLMKIQENQTYTSPLGPVKRRTTLQSVHKARRITKRLSVPLHALSTVFENETVCVRTPVQTSREKEQPTRTEFVSPFKKETMGSYTPINKSSHVGSSPECKSVDRYVCDEKRDVQKLIQGVASAILNEMKKEELDNDSIQQKVKEHETTIVKMNKERLLLEKQLSDFTKSSENKKTDNHQNKRTKTTGLVATNSKSNDFLIKQLEKDLERKKNDLLRTKEELKQTQNQLHEIPTLKGELSKNQQELKRINKSMHCCQEENTRLKKEIDKCNTLLVNKNKIIKEHQEISDKNLEELKAQLKQSTAATNGIRKQLEKSQKDLWSMRSKLDHRSSEVKKLQEQNRSQEKELDMNNSYYQILARITERMETEISQVELKKLSQLKYQNSLELQVKEISEKCCSTEAQLEKAKQAIEEQLKKMRANEDVLKSENQKLLENVTSLQSELDINRLEILRQQGLITTAEEKLHQAKIQLYQYEEHLELLEAQEKEVNEFVVQERRTLVNTAQDLERQLLSTKDELCQLNMSFKEKSLKCEEFVAEVELSKNQLQEKQEELNATQSQAHWMLLQQQTEIFQADEVLKEAWDIVETMLKQYTQDAEIYTEQNCKVADLHEGPVNETEGEKCDLQSSPRLLSSSSLVHRVLEASAKRENEKEAREDKPEITIIDGQLTGFPEQEFPEPLTTRRALNYNQVKHETSIVKESEPQSLSDQIHKLKQALECLAEVGSGKTADIQAKTMIKRLEEERKQLERNLDTARNKEIQLRNEIKQHCVQKANLKTSLEESQHNFQLAMTKLDSLSQQCSDQIEMETRLQMLTRESKNMAEDVKKLENEKECLSLELKEAFDRLDQLTGDKSNGNEGQMIGKLLDEKFTLEKRLKQVKEKSHNYRLEMQDYVSEYRIKTDNKIRILERNLEKAESEIFRLDDLIERIRVTLNQHRKQIQDLPDIGELLKFIEGEDH